MYCMYRQSPRPTGILHLDFKASEQYDFDLKGQQHKTLTQPQKWQCDQGHLSIFSGVRKQLHNHEVLHASCTHQSIVVSSVHRSSIVDQFTDNQVLAVVQTGHMQ